MDQKMFQVPAQLDGISPLKDGGMSLRFHTQEIPAESKVDLMNYYQTFGYLLFKPDEITVKEIPTKNSEGKTVKTPSQRVRGALWVLGKYKGLKVDAEQEIYYERRMERFLDQIKEEIEIEKEEQV